MDVVKVGKTGNSVTITLPANVRDKLELKKGDWVKWVAFKGVAQIRKIEPPTKNAKA